MSKKNWKSWNVTRVLTIIQLNTNVVGIETTYQYYYCNETFCRKKKRGKLQCDHTKKNIQLEAVLTEWSYNRLKKKDSFATHGSKN